MKLLKTVLVSFSVLGVSTVYAVASAPAAFAGKGECEGKDNGHQGSSGGDTGSTRNGGDGSKTGA